MAAGYPFVDHNNWFSIHKLDNDVALDGLSTIQSGDTVYLKHVGSERGLYVHGFQAPVR
jgi:dolichyl-phosphate-mannose--protein O-mannosyl transferase